MPVYDSKRILTVRELRIGDVLHGMMLAGHCVKWTVTNKSGQYAFLKIGDTVAIATGHDLRETAFYLANNCPNCALQHQVKPSAIPELHTIPRQILAADVPSSFRFRAAQYRRKTSR